MLLWSIEEPPIMSGTVLPVYIRSNIDQVWVVGVPDSYRRARQSTNKIEIPLSQLEFAGSKRKAIRRSNEFAEFALAYAENLQDGLPIRETADNSARRVYRMRGGQIIKILEKAEGTPPISATGDPLPGDWYKVLTHDGVTGFCFSYRLRLFDYSDLENRQGVLVQTERAEDPDLDMILSRTWSPELYQQMITNRRVNLSELEKNYRFDPGQETGVVKIVMPDLQQEFPYSSIISEGSRSWRFDGTNLSMNLRSNNTLAVQFPDGSGLRRTLLFVALNQDIDDVILQENARRETQFMSIFNQGPVFTSNNYGTITFTRGGNFTWTGFDLLMPQLLPNNTRGEGRVLMDLFIASNLTDRYNGALTFRFAGNQNIRLRFMYGLDNQGLRLEVVPDYAIEDDTVVRQVTSPMILYFFRDSL